MYLLEYDVNGKLQKITPSPERGLVGIYLNELPITEEQLKTQSYVEELADDNNKLYYRIKGD